MPFGKITTPEEMADFFMDTSKFKSIAAEMAQHSAPPDLSGFNVQELEATMGAQAQAAPPPGVNPEAVAQGANLPTEQSLRAGNTAGPPPDNAIANLIGGAAGALQPPPQAAAPPGGHIAGGSGQATPVTIPNGPDNTIQTLTDLLARR